MKVISISGIIFQTSKDKYVWAFQVVIWKPCSDSIFFFFFNLGNKLITQHYNITVESLQDHHMEKETIVEQTIYI